MFPISTSHNATTFSLPSSEAYQRSDVPLPPTPIPAILILSLGEVKPLPPRTYLGTIKKLDAAKVPCLINSLLLFFLELFLLL